MRAAAACRQASASALRWPAPCTATPPSSFWTNRISNLDSEGQEALAQVLDALLERRITTVLITHNIRLLRRVDRIGVMSEGQLVSFGPRDEVLGQFAKPKARPGRAARQPAGPAKPIQVKYTQ